MISRFILSISAAVLLALSGQVSAQQFNLAPGFTQRGTASKLVVVQPDVELFSLSAGGVPEPRADWTAAAQKHIQGALAAQSARIGSSWVVLEESTVADLAELNDLHGAVATSVFIHHARPQLGNLPTKDGKLDWSLGDAMEPLRARTGADYALFIWIRDSYASAERKAAMVALALLGVGVTGGIQIGYASLVDLKTGRLVWFNALTRASGDLRESEAAKESIELLLTHFPPVSP